jgi:hypothetical protein
MLKRKARREGSYGIDVLADVNGAGSNGHVKMRSGVASSVVTDSPVDILFKELSAWFVKKTNFPFGLYGKQTRENWPKAVSLYGEAKMRRALEFFSETQNIAGMTHPCSVFLSWIETYELTPEEVDDGTEEYLAMIRREKEKLKKRNG